MEKKKYIKPLLTSEEFVPQEYCAACGTSGTKYWFECGGRDDDPFNPMKGMTTGEVFMETNGHPGLQFGKLGTDIPGVEDDKVWKIEGGSYVICHDRHEVSLNAGFIEGYVNPPHGNYVHVLIWTGLGGDNLHCTPYLDKSHWQTTKS